MKEFVTSQNDLLNRFNTDPSAGLTTEQAVRNQTEYGSNTLTKEKPQSLSRRIFEVAA